MHDSTREEINQYNKYQTIPAAHFQRREYCDFLDTILGDVSHIDLFAREKNDKVEITAMLLSNNSSGCEDLKQCGVNSIEGNFRLNWLENKMTANSPEWKKLNLL